MSILLDRKLGINMLIYSPEGGMDIDYQAYRPSILYLNGSYMGIHNIREKIDEHYIESNFGIDKDSMSYF